LGNGSAVVVVVKGCKFAEFEFDLLKKPDIAFFIPEVESFDVNVGLFCKGVFGVSATGVALSFPAEGGGVGEVFSMRGGVCIAPLAGAWPFILSWKVGGWCESMGVRGSFAASLLVSSSSSSGIGLLRSTGRDSGDEV
jgi:hypothetical protein